MYFEKISYDQYLKDCSDYNFPMTAIKLPKRATQSSAGYDFYSPIDFVLNPGEEIKLPTGIRVILENDKFLMIVPRSGLGFKYGVRLKNTIGIIDADYSNSDNEGHIWVKLDYPVLNVSQKPMEIKKGDAICQGIICSYYKVDDDNVENIRNGGFGSTNK